MRSARWCMPGDNIISVIAAPFTIHTELEAGVCAGELRAGECGARVHDDPRDGRCGPVHGTNRGCRSMPMACGTRRSTPRTQRKARIAQYSVQLGKWRGVVAQVSSEREECGDHCVPAVRAGHHEADEAGEEQRERDSVRLAQEYAGSAPRRSAAGDGVAGELSEGRGWRGSAGVDVFCSGIWALRGLLSSEK